MINIFRKILVSRRMLLVRLLYGKYSSSKCALSQYISLFLVTYALEL